jgi:hypothetical protein
MRTPCYDVKTKTDCPKRKVGCRKDCKAWAEHEAERKACYKQRLKMVLSKAEDVLFRKG